MYLIAFFYPTILVNLCVPPNPGINPKLISGNINYAFYVATIISQSKANSKPPPKAFPLTAAMIGFLTSIMLFSLCND